MKDQNIQHEIAETIVATSRDLNNVLQSEGVRFAFRTHYVDIVNDINGIEQLLESIFIKHDAILPKGCHLDAESRALAVSKGLLFSDIVSEVRHCFGFERYPDESIRVYLCNRMPEVVRFQLFNHEDTNRPSVARKPRKKFYLAEKVAGE